MSRTNKNPKNSIPDWQIERMKGIIADRWLETWNIVETRERNRDRNL